MHFSLTFKGKSRQDNHVPFSVSTMQAMLSNSNINQLNPSIVKNYPIDEAVTYEFGQRQSARLVLIIRLISYL